MSSKIIDHSDEYIRAKNAAISKALEKIGLKAEGYAKLICPVDTGRLRNSISHTQADQDTEIIGTNVEYAPYVELGTQRQRAQPYLKPAAADHITEYVQIIVNELKNA